MVTHSTTNLPLIGLTLGEQTGSRIFQWIWSYVTMFLIKSAYNATTTTFFKGRAKKQKHTTAGVRQWSPT
ncbi:hypothetical protein HDV64DRAFT_132032 [Trichoderma sp. TUCIM 5745]